MMRKEQTLVIIKPDGIQRSLIGEILRRLERIGLKLVALKMVVPDKKQIEKHYTLDPEWIEKVGNKTISAYKSKGQKPIDSDPISAGKRVLDVLTHYMTFGPVVAMVWQGCHSVEIFRKIVGGTEPLSSDVGTIRGDFVMDSYAFADLSGRGIRNLIHASSSVEDAQKEIDLWFDKKEIVNYRLVQEQILYDVNLDGILE
jgi:nucleoside-diphosphate kinase